MDVDRELWCKAFRMSGAPHGTVTFLFTDLEGSTRLWDRHPEEMRAALAVHDEILRSEIDSHGGYVFSTGGDAFAAAFWTARDAVDAAVAGQRRLAAEDWPEPVVLRVRMGVHTGVADERGGDYFGPTLNRTARLMALADGGQVLISAATERLLDAGGGPGWMVSELGEVVLKDVSQPERVFALIGDGLPRPARPLTSSMFRSDNLPRQPTSFIGRDADMVRLDDLLGSLQMITLVGPGGAGKTRLGLQVAEAMVDRFDSVNFADLAPITEVELVADRLIEALGYVANGLSKAEVDAALVGRIGDRHVLLILDNCEHVVAECARVVTLLVARCPRLVILATSRQPLAVAGEQVVPVGPLTTPEPASGVSEVEGSAAGRLFVDRARRVRPGFVVTDANVRAVVDICRQVEGLPLAIELAAARVRAMTPTAIARRLAESYRVLGDGPQAGDPRHRSLEACLRWSFEALSDGEAAVLRRMSVMVGGATLDAARAVCAGPDIEPDDVDELLVSLVDKSLVLAEERDGDLRYRLHELVRQFGAARLQEVGEGVETGARHLAWCTELVRRVSPGVRSVNDLESVDPLLPEADNLASAVAFALDRHDAVSLARLLGGGGEMWAHVGRMRQLCLWWDATLPLLPEAPDSHFPPNRLALALASAVAAQLNTGRYADAATLLRRAETISGASAEAVGLLRWLDVCRQGLVGDDPTTVVSSLEQLTAAATDALARRRGGHAGGARRLAGRHRRFDPGSSRRRASRDRSRTVVADVAAGRVRRTGGRRRAARSPGHRH